VSEYQSELIFGEIKHSFHIPFVPTAFQRLAETQDYLQHVWPALKFSLDTVGFLSSACYMSDMAMDATEEVYEPIFSLASNETRELAQIIDLFHYVQPQILLILAALREALDRDSVGGAGSVESRALTERESIHRNTEVALGKEFKESGDMAGVLGLDKPPDLYRALAHFPKFLGPVWEEIKELQAYPEFRRRARALYYYSKSGSRFLASPLSANDLVLGKLGIEANAISKIRECLEEELLQTATMMMHVEAMRLVIGINTREVVTK
jgi:hypothetical protein